MYLDDRPDREVARLPEDERRAAAATVAADVGPERP